MMINPFVMINDEGVSGSLAFSNKQLVVIANAIPKPSHLIGIPWHNCPAEMKDNIPQVVDRLKLHVQQIA